MKSKEKSKLSQGKLKWKYFILTLWDSAKPFLRGKFIALNAYLEEEKKNTASVYEREWGVVCSKEEILDMSEVLLKCSVI